MKAQEKEKMKKEEDIIGVKEGGVLHLISIEVFMLV